MKKLFLCLLLLAPAAIARAEETAEKPYLVLNTGGHTAPIWKILFTPDGKRLVSVSQDKTIRIWDAVTGERLGVLRPPVGRDNEGELRAAALSPDGATLAVGGNSYAVGNKRVVPIFLIDLANGRVTATLEGGGANRAVHSLAFSHDGKLLASGYGNGRAVLWDVNAGRPIHALEGHTSFVSDLAFSPNDKLLATASHDGTARLWSVADGKDQVGPLTQQGGLMCVAWKDDDTLATGGFNQDFVHLWDRTGKMLRRFDKPRWKAGTVTSLAFLPGGKELFYVWATGPEREDDQLRQSGGSFLDLESAETHWRDGYKWDHHIGPVYGAVSPDGQLAATSGGDEGRIDLWAVKDGKQLRELRSKALTPFRAYWGEGGAVVAWDQSQKGVSGANEEVAQKAFDLGELRFSSGKGLKFNGALHERADGSLAQSGLREVEVKREKTVVKIEVSSVVRCFTFLDGDRVAVGSRERLDLFDARTGALIRGFRGHVGRVWSVAPSPDGRYLLACFSDQTLHIYDPDKEEPLLSLFTAGADWIVWTRDGYYAASPGGERLMGWQVNNGLNQLGTFYPAERFHASLYRPDVIRRVLAEGSVEKALAAADKEKGKATEAVSVAQALPPEVSLITPAAGKLNAAEVEVKAQAQSKDRSIVTMRLLLDGRPCPGAGAVTFSKAKPGDKQEASWKVTVPDGEHHLSVLAETAASLGSSSELFVSWQSPTQEPLPKLYVLAIGVNDYPGSLKLNWAVKDATAVAAAFKGGGAPKPYGKVEAKLLLDKDAAKQGILGGLEWLKAKMTADDTAVVFYAGHGHRDKKTSQFYMLPQDVDVGDLEKTGVTGTQIKEKLKTMPGKVLVLLDACHIGSIGDSPADPQSLTDEVQRQLAAPDCGVVILCAAMAQEEAGEAAAVKHGFFTAALLQGLGGEAPADKKDGLIHLTGLDFYIEQAVSELSKDEQHVVVDRPATVTSFPLVKPPGKTPEK